MYPNETIIRDLLQQCYYDNDCAKYNKIINNGGVLICLKEKELIEKSLGTYKLFDCYKNLKCTEPMVVKSYDCMNNCIEKIKTIYFS
jgi:hypothetical protein